MESILINAFDRRRGAFQIMAEILHTARRPATSTQIMTRCNLSYAQLRRYLRMMRLRGLIERDLQKKATYFTTSTGRSFLTHYNDIGELLQTVPCEYP
jgi:predicted transcriptional regulator